MRVMSDSLANRLEKLLLKRFILRAEENEIKNAEKKELLEILDNEQQSKIDKLKQKIMNNENNKEKFRRYVQAFNHCMNKRKDIQVSDTVRKIMIEGALIPIYEIFDPYIKLDYQLHTKIVCDIYKRLIKQKFKNPNDIKNKKVEDILAGNNKLAISKQEGILKEFILNNKKYFNLNKRTLNLIANVRLDSKKNIQQHKDSAILSYIAKYLQDIKNKRNSF